LRSTPSDITEPEVHVEHPEIVHYTDWAGLQGIVSQRVIWATRYDHLNDSSEIVHLESRLSRAIEPHVARRLKDHMRKSFRAQRAIREAGGLSAAAKNDARAIVEGAYKAHFSGSLTASAFSIPFIASFCSHTADETYLKENGLLSQWRAYGGAGKERYAIVFDTLGLKMLLDKEFARYRYLFGQFSDVIYDDDGLRFDEKFANLISETCQAYDALYSEKRHEDIPERLFHDLLAVATRLKHRAFREEREVRISVSPLTIESRRDIMHHAGFDEAEGKEIKPVLHRDRGGKSVPYISLFDGLSSALPIRRVIVGPCRNQSSAIDKASDLLGPGLKIVRSETPFIG
jgi:hypothetical protein